MATEALSALAELQREEEALNARFNKLLSSTADLTRSLQKLDLLRAQSQSLQVTCSSLLSGLERTASVAERISSNVRNLDQEQSRVKETLKYVEEVKELKACVLGAHQSMESQDWELAAQFVFRASLVPQSIAKGQFAALMVPTADTPLSPSATIREASDSLFQLFTREFRAAAAAKDSVKITQFFRLFPKIGKADQGLNLYADFISSIISERARSALNSPTTSSVHYAGLLTGLFEAIAKIISNHTPLIHRFYPKNIDRVLGILQKECDARGIMILDTMFAERQISKTIGEIKSYSFSFLVQTFMPSSRESGGHQEREVDTRQLDALLSEISLIFSRWSLYSGFMRGLATAEPTFLSSSALSAYLNSRLESAYETMEGYFMRRSVERAFQIETTLTADSGHPLSSIVEDVMYILRKVTSRALDTTSVKTMSSIFAVVRRIMEHDYAGVLGKRMQDLQKRITAPTNQVIVVKNADSERRDKENYTLLLNNLDVSVSYIGKIVEEHTTSPSIDNYNEKDAALQIIHVFASLIDRFNSSLEDGVNLLYVSYIRPKLRPLISDMFKDQSWVLSEATYGELQFADPVVQRFVSNWGVMVGSFSTLLSANVFFLLQMQVVKHLSRMLEKKLMSLKFNELGGLRIDKDMSTVIAHVTRDTPAIRQKFERLREICAVMTWDGDEAGDAATIINELGLGKIGFDEVQATRANIVLD